MSTEKLDTHHAGEDFGIDSDKLQTIAEHLVNAVADTYQLYIATQYTHWNIKGRAFYSLHAMFEDQYTALAAAIDDIAERLRTIGYKAPGSLAGMARRSSFEFPEVEATEDMLKKLIAGHSSTLKTLRRGIEAAVEAGDLSTEDFLTARLQEHEKTIWMLRSAI